MIKKTVKFNLIYDITQLVKFATMVEGDVILHRGSFSVDAKSILGVMSIDLSSGVTIQYPDDAPQEFIDFISDFEI